jgi:hypothetical protein
MEATRQATSRRFGFIFEALKQTIPKNGWLYDPLFDDIWGRCYDHNFLRFDDIWGQCYNLKILSPEKWRVYLLVYVKKS